MALARSLNQRTGRVAVGKFLAQGPQAVEYGLRARQIEAILFTDEGLRTFGDLERSAHNQAVSVYVIDERTSKVIAGTNSPQGVTGIATLPHPVVGWVGTKARFVVMLEQAQDPGNVGTIIRTADAAGADLVILGPGSADPYGPKCVRASAGSVFGVQIAATDSPVAEIDAARSAGMSVLATAADGSVSAFDDGTLARFAPPVMWVFGNEARGLDSATREACDEAVKIPISGGAESMNVAAAAAVCLFTSARATRNLG